MQKRTKNGIAKTKKVTEAVVDNVFYGKVRNVFEQARQFVRTTANFAMVKAYWLVGKLIVEKQGGAAKATYGDGLIDELSRRLTCEFGEGSSVSICSICADSSCRFQKFTHCVNNCVGCEANYIEESQML